MTKKALFFGASVLGLAVGGTLLFNMSGDEGGDITGPGGQETERTILVAEISGHGEVRVAGPCYEGTRGNDVLPPSNSPAGDCYSMMSEGRDFLDATDFEGAVYVRVSAGSDTITLGPGDDVIDIRGGFDVVLDAGAGENVVNLPGMDIPDVNLRVEGEDIILDSKRGSVRMRRQYPREGEAAPIQKMVFEGRSLNASEIYLKAIEGQSSDGDDVLTGTPGDDVIYPGAGNDRISALEGNDTIFYESGDDVIMGSFEGVGQDTLSMPYAYDEVSLSSFDDRDLLIQTPTGTVTLQFQIFFPVGDERSNIERFVFRDGIRTDEDLRRELDLGKQPRGDEQR